MGTSDGRYPRRMRRASVWFGICLLLGACDVADLSRVAVGVAFVAPAGTRPVTDLSLIVGGEKFFRHRLDTGGRTAVTLDPGPSAERQLTVLYTLDGRRRVWEGPRVDAGKGYAIDLTIDRGAVVRWRDCLRPCRLDAGTPVHEDLSVTMPNAR